MLFIRGMIKNQLPCDKQMLLDVGMQLCLHERMSPDKKMNQDEQLHPAEALMNRHIVISY